MLDYLGHHFRNTCNSTSKTFIAKLWKSPKFMNSLSLSSTYFPHSQIRLRKCMISSSSELTFDPFGTKCCNIFRRSLIFSLLCCIVHSIQQAFAFKKNIVHVCIINWLGWTDCNIKHILNLMSIHVNVPSWESFMHNLEASLMTNSNNFEFFFNRWNWVHGEQSLKLGTWWTIIDKFVEMRLSKFFQIIHSWFLMQEWIF